MTYFYMPENSIYPRLHTDLHPTQNSSVWTGPVHSQALADGVWWNHATRVQKVGESHHADDVLLQWSILKYFEPIILFGNPKNPDDDKNHIEDIKWKVIERLWGGSVVDHAGKRSYNEWHGAKQNIMSEIHRMAGREDTDLPRIEQMELRARRLFKQLDTDGNGILDEMELRVGLEHLGVDCSNRSMVVTMMMEADIDGNNGIDFGEFKDVIFRILEEE